LAGTVILERKRKVSAPARRIDPTRTTLIRRAFIADMKRRFAWLKKEITRLVVELDVFGLAPPRILKLEAITANLEVQAWRFRTDPEKVKEFREWLQEKVDEGILTPVGSHDPRPWVTPYIESSYKKGLVNATRGYKKSIGTPPVMVGREGDVLQIGLVGPEATKTIERIYTRAWFDLKGVTDAMAQQLSRTLASGLAAGLHPEVMARQMRQTIDGLTKRRAIVIARTEAIAAHAEAQLDASGCLPGVGTQGRIGSSGVAYGGR